MYNPFVVPFAFGVIILFTNLAIAYIAWVNHLDKEQKRHIRKNIISFKTLAAIWEAFRECLFHRNIFKKNPILGYMHLSLSFGWLILILVGHFEAQVYEGSVLVNPWLAIFFRFFEDGRDYPFKETFTFFMDLLLCFVLSGLLLAFFKRMRSKFLGMKKTTKHTPSDRIALISLWCIFPFRLLAESSTAAIHHNGGFLTQSLGNLLAFLPVEKFVMPLWWAYSIALCLFFVFMPFTRYMHIFTEVLLVFLRKWGIVESQKHTGYTDTEINACSRCGICIDVCQLNTDAGINNVQSVYFIRDARDLSLNRHVVNNCLFCNRCVQACPVGIETTMIRQIYRYKQGNENIPFYEYIDTKKYTANKESAPVLYFAGCMTHLTPGIIDSMKNIFEKAGERFIFIDEDKNICCGRPLRQQGFFEQAEILKDKLATIIKDSGSEVLVTSCPICYKSFVKEYNLDIKVLHHTQYIKELIDKGLIKLSKQDTTFVYHDPCEISRGSNIYKEPRAILDLLGTLQSSENEKDDALCCGGSLANTELDPEQAAAIACQTLNVLTKNNPDCVVTSCPLCKKTFNKNNKTTNILDISEIVSRNI
ncbi:4Fe-4S dicluster domain-containing protein [Bacteroidales bacterium OttesenSCG-928-K22]|nr:4Fe-4S dicluster domain-containing protein [Bacteroidales bacterium OttesenSCG-928-K22]